MTDYEYIFRQMKKFYYTKWDDEELKKCVDMLPSLSREELFSLFRSRWLANTKALREAIVSELAKRPMEKKEIRRECQNTTKDVAKPLKTIKRLELEIQENLPESQHADASKLLGEAMLSGDFNAFGDIIDNDAELVIYGSKTIVGKEAILEYWQGWKERYVDSGKVTRVEVRHNNYYSHACLEMGPMLVLFYFQNGYIRKILLIQRCLNPIEGHYADMLDFRFDLYSIKDCIGESRNQSGVKENRTFCFSCGTPSEQLEWYDFIGKMKERGRSAIVSVCPHCHKVVEYYPQHEDSVLLLECAKTIQPHSYEKQEKNVASADKENAYSAKATDFHWQLKKKGNDTIFNDLDALSLKDGYHIGLRIAEQQGIGDESNFYVYNQDNEKDMDLLKYIHVDETQMGAWQVYLLMTSPTMLPTFWHGNYIKRKFILEKKDLFEIEALKYYDLSDLAQDSMSYPSVSIESNDGVTIAHVYCCYWNEWKGLVREHVKMSICNGKVESCENVGDFVIYKYHCGIFF